MSWRNSYFDRLGAIYPSKPVYALRATAVDNEGVYTYRLAGRVKEMDYTTQVMTIQDMWGKEWKVHFLTEPYVGMGGLSKLVVSQKNIGTGEEVRNQLTTILIDPQVPEVTKGILPYEMVIVRWQDGRKASRIKGMIELKSEKIVPIIRVVVEGTQ